MEYLDLVWVSHSHSLNSAFSMRMPLLYGNNTNTHKEGYSKRWVVWQTVHQQDGIALKGNANNYQQGGNRNTDEEVKVQSQAKAI